MNTTLAVMMCIRIQEVNDSNLGLVEGHLKVDVLYFYMYVHS
jgi:hypothetical protein